MATQTGYTEATDNETTVYNYLTKQGFTKTQTAGIMGNLRQEHNYQTFGDGLAQWTDGRRARLLARDNPYELSTQLDYLMEELNGAYAYVRDEIKATDNVYQATIIFQNKFERCGICMQDNRVNYAWDVFNKF